MDSFIASMPCQIDDDLALCIADGVAYQRDQSALVEYDGDYFGKCASYESGSIALAINQGREAFVAHHYSAKLPVLDVGIGCGEFIKWRGNHTYGTDVNPAAVEWLKSQGLLARDIGAFSAYSFWDVIEHVPRPADYFDRIKPGAYLFTSLPIFDDLRRVRESKHYRPGEHLYYWTQPGFVNWMRLHRFELLGIETFETRAGRDSIYSFAFRKG